MCCIEISQLKGKQKVLFSNHKYVWFVWKPPKWRIGIFWWFSFFQCDATDRVWPKFLGHTLRCTHNIYIALRFHNKTPQTGFGLLKQQTSGQSSWDAQGQPGDDDGDNDDDDDGGDGDDDGDNDDDGGDGDGDAHCTGST